MKLGSAKLKCSSFTHRKYSYLLHLGPMFISFEQVKMLSTTWISTVSSSISIELTSKRSGCSLVLATCDWALKWETTGRVDRSKNLKVSNNSLFFSSPLTPCSVWCNWYTKCPKVETNYASFVLTSRRDATIMVHLLSSTSLKVSHALDIRTSYLALQEWRRQLRSSTKTDKHKN